jgi:hypothetical protein
MSYSSTRKTHNEEVEEAVTTHKKIGVNRLKGAT